MPRNFAALAFASLLLSGCGALDRLEQIGKSPELTPMGNTPKSQPQKVSLPMPSPEPESRNGNSLWRAGARTFFRDPRAARVGDILTVNIAITDQAQLANETVRSRKNSEDETMPNLLGAEASKFLTKRLGANPASLVNVGGTSSSDGTGTVKRQESVTLTVAAVVTQVMPNGNLVIEGRQEVRVNFEVRELYIGGVVRPEDISNTNTINHTQIAEARVSYGGRGQLTDVQQPRYGQQFFDIILPF